MSNLRLNDTALFSAPKNAGTTLRMWLTHYHGNLPDFEADQGYYTLRDIGMPALWHDNLVASPRLFSLEGTANDIKWCIKRDPVARFESAYTDKIMRANAAPWSVDECLDLLESGKMLSYAQEKIGYWMVACHFLPQAAWMGDDPDLYDHIFDISQMDLVKEFCEDTVFKIRLPNLHARQQTRSGVERVSLTLDQKRRLENIQDIDYKCGWH